MRSNQTGDFDSDGDDMFSFLDPELKAMGAQNWSNEKLMMASWIFALAAEALKDQFLLLKGGQQPDPLLQPWFLPRKRRPRNGRR